MKTIASSKTTKIIVDICMTIFLILSFVRWSGDGGFIFHAIVGTACALFFTLHVCIHWKWIKAMTKSCMAGKLNKSLKWKYVIDMILLVVWGVAVASGFVAVGYFVGGVYGLAGFSQVHGVSARVGLVLVIVHVLQHLPQIKSYFGVKK